MGLGGALQVRREIQPGLCGRGAAREGLAGGGRAALGRSGKRASYACSAWIHSLGSKRGLAGHYSEPQIKSMLFSLSKASPVGLGDACQRMTLHVCEERTRPTLYRRALCSWLRFQRVVHIWKVSWSHGCVSVPAIRGHGQLSPQPSLWLP